MQKIKEAILSSKVLFNVLKIEFFIVTKFIFLTSNASYLLATETTGTLDPQTQTKANHKTKTKKSLPNKTKIASFIKCFIGQTRSKKKYLTKWALHRFMHLKLAQALQYKLWSLLQTTIYLILDGQMVTVIIRLK